MPFSFLQLPPEVRRKVYNFLLVTNNKHQYVFPDVNGTARRMQLSWIFLPDMGDSLSLLVTCKLINQEASAVLYGKNKYVFDDRPYTSEGTDIPACDFTYLYSWLHHIGAENRKRLQWIQLRFRTLVFLCCREDGKTAARAQINYAGALYLIEVFKLLAQGHGLRYLRLEFDSMHHYVRNETLYQHLFRSLGDSRLLKQMIKIRGLQELQVSVGKAIKIGNGSSVGDVVFRYMKERMEAKEPVTTQEGSQLQAQPRTLGGRIKELEEKCQTLKQTALRTNQQWKQEVRQVKEIEDTLTKIQAAVSKHLQRGPPP